MYSPKRCKGFPDGAVGKNPSAMQEMQDTVAQFPGQEYTLEEEMATHSSIFAWRIPWTEEPGEEPYSPGDRKESDTTEQLNWKWIMEFSFNYPFSIVCSKNKE